MYTYMYYNFSERGGVWDGASMVSVPLIIIFTRAQKVLLSRTPFSTQGVQPQKKKIYRSNSGRIIISILKMCMPAMVAPERPSPESID